MLHFIANVHLFFNLSVIVLTRQYLCTFLSEVDYAKHLVHWLEEKPAIFNTVVLLKNTLSEKALEFAPLKKYGSSVLIFFPLQKGGDSTPTVKTDSFWTEGLGSPLRKGISFFQRRRLI